MQDVLNIISNVGFPIAVCVFLLSYLKSVTTKHTNEIDALKQTLHENTKVLTELTTLIKHLTYGKTKGNTL